MKNLIFLILIFFTGNLTTAQVNTYNKGSRYCSERKMNNPNVLPKLGDSPNTPRHSYDVLNYKLNLDVYSCFLIPYPKSFTASNIMTFRVDSTLNSIQLNVDDSSLVIDSVSMAGVTFTHISDILTINLNQTYNPGAMVKVKIFYRHNNIFDGAFYAENGVLFTNCQPEGARKWFPCWDKPSDKATLDLTAKVPSSVKLGSNGILVDSTVTGDTIYYNWKSNDKMATYLVVMTGKVNYNLDILYWHKPSNPNDSIPMRFYWNTGENQSELNNIKNKITLITNHFSNVYGEYPFEKIGFASIQPSLHGAMENQTLTSMCYNCWIEWLIAHEHAHQWFGDLITCGTWADIWLNEGFATYSEAIWKEYYGGYSLYKDDIDSNANFYLILNPGLPIYNPSWAITTPPNNLLFNYAITYLKPSCMLHMLRYILGDTLFFHAIKEYATDTVNFKHKNVVTADFMDKMNQVTGQNLDWFFNQWLYEPNHPIYQNTYNIADLGGGSWGVDFTAYQTQTTPPFFKMPIELKISFTSGPDSIIKVMNDVNNQTFNFNFNRQPTSLIFDPDNQIVLKEATTVGVNNVSTNLPDKFALYHNFPNPFNPKTNIRFDLPKSLDAKLIVYDMLGKEIAILVNGKLNAGSYEVEWPAPSGDGSSYPSGVYFYRLTAGNFMEVRKMILLK